MTMKQEVFGGQTRNDRSVWQAMARGFACRCPHCGKGKLFGKFLKVSDRCEACGEEYHHHRADDLPAYLVIFVVGHVILGLFMGVERMFELSAWTHLAILVPVTIASCLLLLQPIKGAVVGLQWALRMHGFSGEREALDTHPEL